MSFRGEKKLFGLMTPNVRAALPRSTRGVTFSVEAMEARASLSGIAVNPGVICGFNPQPDPPARSALIGQIGATTNGSQSAAPFHFDVPPGPC
jgi:hypothetical protein